VSESESESESKSDSDLPDFIPAHLIESEPYFDRQSTREERRGGRQAQIPPAREGLPPTYRMRADAHYVDQLTASSTGPALQLLNVDELAPPNDAAAPPPAAFVASVARHKLLQPLLVQRQRGRYRVIDGHKRLAAAIAAGLKEVPCLLHDVDDVEAAALAEAANLLRQEPASAPLPKAPAADTTATIGRELVQSLAAATSSVNLLSPTTAGLSRLVAVDLISAELWRSSCLLEAGRMLRGEKAIALAAVRPTRVLERVAGQMATEARLRGVTLGVKAIDLPSEAMLRTDENLVVVALSSMLLMTFVLVEHVHSANVAISASARTTSAVVFDVSQDAVIVPAPWAERAFDATWIDRPGGVPASVWMLGAQRIAESLGGRVSAMATVVGTTISLTLPISTGA
jgi:hypothetical protein